MWTLALMCCQPLQMAESDTSIRAERLLSSKVACPRLNQLRGKCSMHLDASCPSQAAGTNLDCLHLPSQTFGSRSSCLMASILGKEQWPSWRETQFSRLS